MKRSIVYCFIFLVVMVISVVAHTPVSFALKYMPPAKGLLIEMPTGTLWKGEVQKVSWQGESYGQLSWQFQPSELLSGKAGYQIRFGRGSEAKLMGKGEVGVGFGGFYAENIVASVPATNALKKFAVPLPVTVEGNLELSIASYQYAQPWCSDAKGTLVWNGSQILSPLGGLDLGTVVVNLNCANSTITASGNHNTSQVEGALEAELTPEKRYSLNTWFKPNEAFPQSMKSQLKWLGRPDSEGAFPFTYAGKLN